MRNRLPVKSMICGLALALALVPAPSAPSKAKPATAKPAAAAPAQQPGLVLASKGKAAHPVVVSATATELVKTAAQELAEILTKISGAPFSVVTGDGTSGLAVGVAADFPAVKTGITFDAGDPRTRESFLLRTHARGAYLIGASPVATRNAVWDFLGRLGYRLYLPTDTWEIIPNTPELRIAVNALETPDYITRDAPRGAPWSNAQLMSRWKIRNRMISAFAMSTGHAYDDIIRKNKAAFDAHPEYLGLVDGKRGGSKFCIANPGLRALVVNYAVETMKANPAQDSISMEPSDGGGWCTCDDCRKMGSVSTRVVTLANEVAVAINALGLGKKYVAFYAYNEHSPPPAIDAHPQVIVNLATSFIRGGLTIDGMIEGWKAKKATLGIRDYHDVFTWSHDLPRSARGGDIAYLTRTIPHFYQNGARFMNSENGDSWGANGLGYWLTPQLLWDTDNAKRVDALLDDFLQKSFGAAKEPMRDFYTLINRDRSIRTNEDVVARMYRYLADAKTRTKDAAVQRRLNDLVLYTRYLELYYGYQSASGAKRQQGFEQIWRHAYRIKDRMLCFTAAICDREKFRDRSVTVPAEADWSVPEGKNPWKSSAPFTEEEIATILQQGIAANQVNDPGFKTVTFSSDLVPAARLGLTAPPAGTITYVGRGTRTYLIWLDKPGTFTLRVTGGLIAHYRDRGNVKIDLYSPKNVTLDAVTHDESVPPDGKPYDVALKSEFDGLHTLTISDGSDMTNLEFPADLPVTVTSGLGNPPPGLGSRWSLYCYVPKGTTLVGGYTDSKIGKLLDGAGKVVFDFATLDDLGYFRIPVPAGADGALWRFDGCAGNRLLMTIPPYLAPTMKDLLLPAEVVKKDMPKGR